MLKARESKPRASNPQKIKSILILQVVCPAHDAAFDIAAGANLRGPHLQGIETYPIEIDEETGNVFVALGAGSLGAMT
jgi:nitrite reductase/ring-hydroxylating ferredoxin subunit